MEALTITIKESSDLKGVTIAHFEGAFDGGAKEPIAELKKLVDESESEMNLILDFTDVTYLNSYAIGELVSWQNHLMKNGGQIIIAGPNKNVEDIFGILGISNMFKIFPDVESAEETLKH